MDKSWSLLLREKQFGSYVAPLWGLNEQGWTVWRFGESTNDSITFAHFPFVNSNALLLNKPFHKNALDRFCYYLNGNSLKQRFVHCVYMKGTTTTKKVSSSNSKHNMLISDPRSFRLHVVLRRGINNSWLQKCQKCYFHPLPHPLSQSPNWWCDTKTPDILFPHLKQ